LEIAVKYQTLRNGVAAGVISLALISGAAMAADAPATQPSAAAPSPATQPSSASPAGADQLFLTKEHAFLSALQESNKAVGKPDELSDAAHRQQFAPTAIPALKKAMASLEDLAAEHKVPEQQITSLRTSLSSSLYLLGDKDTVADIDAKANGTDAAAKTTSQIVQVMARWRMSSTDDAAKAKIADQIVQLDQSDPTNTSLTILSYQFSQSTKDKAIAEKLSNAAVAMNNRAATQIKTMVEGQKRLASLEGKPMVVSGKSVDGSDFTTAQWKGKVVLVDFWATWCGPCRAELPNVKAAYSKYHDQGLEIIGVSNDFSKDALTKYTPENGMTWPELFDADAAATHNWNPITLGYGVEGIPTMFLIDRNGICTTVTARGNLETEIPKLLAQPGTKTE
jgi:thiol-disulfide isomerase/thioredoxin